ncbi:hypothetical protein [Actinosynnema sp.]|uniref:hypothetical protein n=1 Tax=Actinosynnema sp. TaxID=1872144 RepID=UPI003F85F930
MTWLTFISQMTSALVWPVVVLIIVLVLRKPIGQLLTDPGLKKIKAWQFEAELDRVRSQAVEQLETASPPDEAPRVIAEELAADVSQAPVVAVLEAHRAIERELRDIVASSGETTTRASAAGLARLAAKKGLISEASVRSVEGVSHLRNLAAHGNARAITSEQAAEYVQLADAVLYAIKGDYRRTKAGTSADDSA